MNIRDLTYLVAVYDVKSFSKAAEQCFVSQPTLSGQIKKLENFLSIQLIERSTRQIVFTSEGERIVDKARETLLCVQQIQQLAKQAHDPFAGELRIGMIPTVGPFLLPDIMPELSANYPKLKIFLSESKTDTLIDGLLKGEVDMAILAKLDWPYAFEEIDLYQEPFLLAVSTKDEKFQDKRLVELSILENQQVLMLEDGHCLRDQAMGVCFSAGANEDQRFKATSMDTLLHMIAANSGITLIPKLACHPRPGVRYIPFKKAPTRKIVLICRKNTSQRQTIQKVAQNIINSVQLTL